MSRGKKAKRKIGGRRKAEAATAATEIAKIVPIDESQPLDLTKDTNTITDNSITRLSCATEETITADSNAITDEIETSRLAILFKNDELQTLRSVLRKTDLSRTPLLLGAIILGKVDVVKRLLRDGYPINCRSEEDKTTALMWAVRNKNLDMINLLVRNGADLTLLDENEDNVALIAIQSSSWEQNDFLDFWNSIDRKIDLKHTNVRGFTILHYAKERRWHVLANLIGNLPENFNTIATVRSNSSCFCCCCSTSSTSSTSMRYKVKEILRREDLDETLNHLTVIFDEIVNRYRQIWARDRELGYPGFRGGHGDSATTTLEQLMRLRREEITRLNAILPNLEESYLKKLRDCWSSLVAKMRQTAATNYRKFEEYVTSIQIQLLTHEVCPRILDNLEFYSPDDKSFDRTVTTNEASSHQNFHSS